jgi:hypothetical protein
MFYIFYSRSLKSKTRKLKLHRHEFDWNHSYLAQAAVISAWCLKEHRPGRWDAEWVDYCLGIALKLIPQRKSHFLVSIRFLPLWSFFSSVSRTPWHLRWISCSHHARHGPGITSTKASSRGAFRWFCQIVTCFLSRLGPRGGSRHGPMWMMDAGGFCSHLLTMSRITGVPGRADANLSLKSGWINTY